MSEAKPYLGAPIPPTGNKDAAAGGGKEEDSDGCGIDPNLSEYFGDVSDRCHLDDDDDDDEEEIKSAKLRIYDDILNLGAKPAVLVEVLPYAGIALQGPLLRNPDILLNQVPIKRPHNEIASHAQSGPEFKDRYEDFEGKDEVPVHHIHEAMYPFKISVLNLKSAAVDRYVRLMYYLGELANNESGVEVLFEFMTADSELFEVSLCGRTEAVVKAVQRISSMVKQALTASKPRHVDLPNWCAQHVLAIKNSKELLEMEKACRSVLRFYSREVQSSCSEEKEAKAGGQLHRCVCAELLGGSTAQREQLIRMLHCLNPRKSSWELPPNLLPAVYHGPYAVFIEPCTASEKNRDVVAEVYGFDDGPELALKDLLSHANEPISIVHMRKARPPTLEIPSQLPTTPPDSAYGSPLSLPAPYRRGPPSLADIANMALSEWSDNDESVLTEATCTPVGENVGNASFDADAKEQITYAETPLTVKVADARNTTMSRFLAAAPTSPSIRPRIKLGGGEFGKQGSFSFRDQEAGIYFQAFQHAFAKALRHAFCTVMAPLEAFEEVHTYNSPAKSSGSSVSSSGSRSVEHTRALRVDIFGSSSKACQQTIAYLSNELGCKLTRIIIYFPRADERVCKALIDVKEKLDTALAAEREQDAVRRRRILELPVGRAVIQNPLDAEGFVNIRFKPFGVAKSGYSLKKFHFPVDLTVTICGPMSSPAHLAAIARCEGAFKAVRSNHHVAEINISSANPYAKIIIPKRLREQFVAKYGLIALRIDELARRGDGIGPKPAGLAGLASIWAPSAQALSRVMHQLKEGEREAEAATQLKLATTAAAPGLTLSFNPNETVREYEELVKHANLSNEDPMLDPNLRAEALGRSGPSVLNSFAQQLAPPNLGRIVVHWPHPSCRFSFLEGGMKAALNSLVQGYRDIGVTITTPFRDKKDASACMLIEAGSDDLSSKQASAAATAVVLFMESVAERLWCMQLKLPRDLLDNLAKGDLSELKILQGAFGVHIILEATVDDMRECTRFFDISAYKGKDKARKEASASLRLPEQLSPASVDPANPLQSPYCDLGHSPLSPAMSFQGAARSNLSGDGSINFSELDGEDPVMQLSFSVTNSLTGLPLTIQVVEDSSSNWTQHGASALVVVLDANADFTLSKAEIAQLASGQALVHIDLEHNRVMLRVRPEQKSGKIEQSRALAKSLTTALEQADSLSVEGVALIAPAFNSLLESLSPDELKTETGGTVLRFARFGQVSHIRLILFLEDAQEELEEANSCLASHASLTTPGENAKRPLTLDHILPGNRTPNALARALNYWLVSLVQEGVCSIIVRDARVQSPQIPQAYQYESSPPEKSVAALAPPAKATTMESDVGASKQLPILTDTQTEKEKRATVIPIGLADTEVLRRGDKNKCKGCGYGKSNQHNGDNSVIVIKGLPNNVLNAVNALWSLKSDFVERETAQVKSRWDASS